MKNICYIKGKDLTKLHHIIFHFVFLYAEHHQGASIPISTVIIPKLS